MPRQAGFSDINSAVAARRVPMLLPAHSIHVRQVWLVVVSTRCSCTTTTTTPPPPICSCTPFMFIHKHHPSTFFTRRHAMTFIKEGSAQHAYQGL